MLNAKAISEAIRAKKKKMMMAPPELVDSGLQPDVNPNDLMHMDNMASIEKTLNPPHKIDADETDMNEEDHGMGLSPEQKTRMGRLRKYAASMDY